MTEESETRNCPKCGKSINAQATRCLFCFEKSVPLPSLPKAKAVSEVPPQQEVQTVISQKRYRTCPHCGKEISANASRCKHCLAEVVALSLSPKAETAPFMGGGACEEDVAMPVAVPVPSSGGARVQYRFQVVPFIGTMKSGFFSSDNAQTVSGQLQTLINHYAQQGWEFYSIEKVDIQINPGCIGNLLGQSASYISFDQVIFRQPL